MSLCTRSNIRRLPVINVRKLVKQNIDHQWLVETTPFILAFFSTAFQLSYAMSRITELKQQQVFFHKLLKYLIGQLALADLQFDITNDDQRRFSLRLCLYQHMYCNSNKSDNRRWHFQICYCWLSTCYYDDTLPETQALVNMISSVFLM